MGWLESGPKVSFYLKSFPTKITLPECIHVGVLVIMIMVRLQLSLHIEFSQFAPQISSHFIGKVKHLLFFFLILLVDT